MLEHADADWSDIVGHARIKPEVIGYPDRMQALIADLRGLTADPVTAYNAAQPEMRDPAAPHVPDHHAEGAGVNPYFEGEADAIRQDPWTALPMLFRYSRFRTDMNLLASRLADFLDRSEPAFFHDVAACLQEAEHLLRRAQGSNGMELVAAALQGWDGDAAVNFRHAFYGPFHEVLDLQAKVLRSVGLAAFGYQQIIMSAQADSLDIATQIRAKLARTGEGGSPGTLLTVVSIVAAGIGALGYPWFFIAWAAGTSALVLDGLARHAHEPSEEDRVVDGDLAMHFIPSANDLLDRLWNAINREESMLREGMQDDLSQLERVIKGGLEPREPDLANSDRPNDLGRKSNVVQYDIEELQRCAKGWLPAMAEMFHQAYRQLVLARGHLNRMLGDNRVAGSQRFALDEVLELLTTAVVRTRDYLYRCGENLSTIAGNYYQNEQQTVEIMQKIESWLADPAEFSLDRYHPPTGRSDTAHHARPV